MSSPAHTPGEQLGDKPSPRPRTDLSGAFGPPSRTGGLAGRLTRPTRPAPQADRAGNQPAADREWPTAGEGDAPAAPVALVQPSSGTAEDTVPAESTTGAPTVAVEEAAATTVARRSPRATKPSARTGRAASSAGRDEGQVEAEGARVTSIVYVPGDVLERLRRARAATGLTYTQLTLDAIDGTHTVLGDIVAKATEPTARPAGSLFSGPSSAPATVNAKVQITLRPRRSDAAVIDRLAADFGTNRSQLVSLALDAHLPRA